MNAIREKIRFVSKESLSCRETNRASDGEPEDNQEGLLHLLRNRFRSPLNRRSGNQRPETSQPHENVRGRSGLRNRFRNSGNSRSAPQPPELPNWDEQTSFRERFQDLLLRFVQSPSAEQEDNDRDLTHTVHIHYEGNMRSIAGILPRGFRIRRRSWPEAGPQDGDDTGTDARVDRVQPDYGGPMSREEGTEDSPEFERRQGTGEVDAPQETSSAAHPARPQGDSVHPGSEGPPQSSGPSASNAGQQRSERATSDSLYEPQRGAESNTTSQTVAQSGGQRRTDVEYIDISAETGQASTPAVDQPVQRGAEDGGGTAEEVLINLLMPTIMSLPGPETVRSVRSI